jgi:hypothetical protein
VQGSGTRIMIFDTRGDKAVLGGESWHAHGISFT